MMRNEISTKKLVEAAKQCSQQSISRAQALRIPYSIRKGNQLVRINPNGSEEVLKQLEPNIKYNGKKVITL